MFLVHCLARVWFAWVVRVLWVVVICAWRFWLVVVYCLVVCGFGCICLSLDFWWFLPVRCLPRVWVSWLVYFLWGWYNILFC